MALRPTIVAILLGLCPMTAGAATQVGDVVLYKVAKGDNLYTLAKHHFIRVADFVAVQRLNRIADPYRLPVGRMLKIPRALLRHEPLPATILAYRGSVRVVRAGTERPAMVGLAVREGDEVVTAANAFVTLGLPDQSAVSLPSQSRVAVRQLRKLTLTGSVERAFDIVTGRTRAIVTPMKDASDDFRFSTPVAVSAVRGTEFQVSYDAENGQATTGVLEGKVDVSSNADRLTQAVPAGFGTVASASGGTDAVALLPAPTLDRPGKVQDEATLRFLLHPLEGASAYRVQVAQDAGFLDVIGETISPSLEAQLPAVPDGTWFVRASAIAGSGLEGLPATFGFERRLNRIEAASESRRVGRYREYLFRWHVEGKGERQYRFQLWRDEESGTPIIDETGLTTQRFVVTDLPPGTYLWRVMTLQFVDGAVHQKWSPTERLTISGDD